MAFHWKVLLWMAAGAVLGLMIQHFCPAPAHSGLVLKETASGLQIESLEPPASASKLKPEMHLKSAISERGTPQEKINPLHTQADFRRLLEESEHGDVIWFNQDSGKAIPLTLVIAPDSMRHKLIAPFVFCAGIFLSLLKMLIVPLVLTSIVNGVASLTQLRDLKRLGAKAMTYYISTTLLAILAGQFLVNLIRPGSNASLGLAPVPEGDVAPEASFISILQNIVPTNVFQSLGQNNDMLQIIFFALLLGLGITLSPEPHKTRIRELFESFSEVTMKLSSMILKLLPYGVFVLMVKVLGTTGFGVFKPLFLYMLTVMIALVFHSLITLPLILKWVGKVSPVRWFRAMTPVLVTAFSTSSSNMTLPVTLETVEKRGNVSPRVCSFVLPLGATINMDGTAIYECIGVIFLAQYYASTGGFVLTLSAQIIIVFLALLASIGAAGIPSAGFVMMLTILSTLGLPLEGAALLLAVDRILDMMRTAVNVWSDTCGAALIASTEGEKNLGL